MAKKRFRSKQSDSPADNLTKQAEELERKGRYYELQELLEPVVKDNPDNLSLLSMLSRVYYRFRDSANYLRITRQVSELDKDNPDVLVALGCAYEIDLKFALALDAFNRFLAGWPHHREADNARKHRQMAQELVDQITADMGLTGERVLAQAMLHEESQVLLESDEFEAAVETVERLLAECPQLISARNNYSQMLFLVGRFAEGVAAASQVLAAEPENFHALSNLARFHLLVGRTDEAQQLANRLRHIESPRPDLYVKKAEAFSFLGDHQVVLEIYREAGGHQLVGPQYFLLHLAAMAAASLGQTEQARKLWRAALLEAPGFGPVRQNLDDLQQPVGMRNGPWASPVELWIRKALAGDLIERLEESGNAGIDEELRRQAAEFLTQRPEVIALVPTMLERGGPDSRGFVLQLARVTQRPEMLKALRDFAFSRNGSDKQRTEAAEVCMEAGLIERGIVRMWTKGQWTEILLIGWELHHDQEPQQFHSPPVEQLATQGMTALRRHNFAEAEQCFNRALALEPDNPTLINNLAANYAMQGRDDESNRLIEELYLKHPDYFFARTNLAAFHARNGDVERAQEMLEPLIKRRRLHVSELAALCGAEIELALAGKRPEVARNWLQTLEQHYPDAPQLKAMRQRVEGPRLGRAFKRFMR